MQGEIPIQSVLKKGSYRIAAKDAIYVEGSPLAVLQG